MSIWAWNLMEAMCAAYFIWPWPQVPTMGWARKATTLLGQDITFTSNPVTHKKLVTPLGLFIHLNLLNKGWVRPMYADLMQRDADKADGHVYRRLGVMHGSNEIVLLWFRIKQRRVGFHFGTMSLVLWSDHSRYKFLNETECLLEGSF